MLSLTSAQYILFMGNPAVRLVIDDKEAFLCEMRKPLLDAGYVYLIGTSTEYNWETILPKTTLPPIQGLTSTTTKLPGITNDSKIIAVAREFQKVLESGIGFEVDKNISF